MTSEPLEATVGRLAAVRDIETLKHRYMRAVDLKDWDLLATTLTPDVTAVYGERLAFATRDEVLDFMRSSVGPDIVTVHHLHQAEIDVHGDEATGTWALDDKVIIPAQRILITGASFYDDRYVRDDDGRWLIAATGYRRLYESIESLDVRTDFRLTENRWA